MNFIKGKKIRKQFETLIIQCENALVHELIQEKVITVETHAENQYYPVPEWVEDTEGLKVKRNINEWWSVHPWFLEQLKKRKETILSTPYGRFWGRCNCGKSVFQDEVVEDIYDDMYG